MTPPSITSDDSIHSSTPKNREKGRIVVFIGYEEQLW